MPKITILAVGISYLGSDLPVGTEIEVSEKSAAALIAEGKAESSEVQAEVKSVLDTGGNEPTEEGKQVDALDAQYKRDELYDAAKEAGVDIAYDAKKGEIIGAVIAQGFAGALLK